MLPRRRRVQRLLPALAWILTARVAVAAGGAPADTDSAVALRAQYAVLRPRLDASVFGQRVVVDSAETTHHLEGSIYAVVDYPYAIVRRAFTSPAAWCEALLLHLNVKRCRADAAGPHAKLAVAVGRKVEQSVNEAFPFEFAFAVSASEADYFRVVLDAPAGPLGTKDYRMTLVGTVLDARHTFVHLRYSYGYGFQVRMAMDAYLATGGHGKVGFTVTGHSADATPTYIGGVRGAIERNAMRYYLALDAYLGALGVPPARQVAERFERWFAATERYPAQLHELDREAYLQMKRHEYQRQQSP